MKSEVYQWYLNDFRHSLRSTSGSVGDKKESQSMVFG